eukprot:COSAG01_NODE_45_length_32100_cov_28.037218_27_plen_1119_part_00
MLCAASISSVLGSLCLAISATTGSSSQAASHHPAAAGETMQGLQQLQDLQDLGSSSCSCSSSSNNKASSSIGDAWAEDCPAREILGASNGRQPALAGCCCCGTAALDGGLICLSQPDGGRVGLPVNTSSSAGVLRLHTLTTGTPYQRHPAESLKTDDDALKAASPCDVTHYGALGDNLTEATSAFQEAIAACVGRTRGAVVVPAGTYVLRPVELFSHTTLVIERGATLVAWSGVGWKAGWPNSTSATCTASPYESKTPVVLPQLESLLYVDGVTNVTIKGGGRLDGQGWRWWPLRDKSQYWHHCKPSLIRLGGGNSTRTSSYLTVDNLALHNSPHFNIQAWTDYSRYTRLNFTADTCPLNTDSLHVGGWNVYVADCNVHSGDDCVPISKYSENVLVERVRCSCGNGASPIIWGTAHDKDAYIRNVSFRDMTFTGTRFGANIKSLASYLGTLHDVVFENFVLHDVAKAINIDLKGQNQRHDDARAQTIRVRNVTFRNFTGDAKIAGTFTCPGTPGTCSGILLEDINITGTQTGFTCIGSVGGHAIRTSPPAKCMDPEEAASFAPPGDAQATAAAAAAAAEQQTRLALKLDDHTNAHTPAGETMQHLQDLGSAGASSGGGSGGWTVCASNRSLCAPATVPGEAHTDLLAAGLIPEPFAEFNELSLRWVALENWTFSRNFTAEPPAAGYGTVSTLIFDGLDTVANVTLNGYTLGQAGNAFVRWEFELPSGLLRIGDGANHLQVSFICAQSAGQTLAYQFPVPLREFRANRYSYGGRPFVRKSQTHFGWNWGPGYITQGIYRGVRLSTLTVRRGRGELNAGSIRSVTVQQLDASTPPPAAAGSEGSTTVWPPLPLPAPSAIQLTLDVEIQVRFKSVEQNPDQMIVSATLPNGGLKVTRRVNCATNRATSSTIVRLTLTVPVAATTRTGSTGRNSSAAATAAPLGLWFPNGYGSQPLWNLTVTLCADSSGQQCAAPWTTKLGLRIATLVQEPLPFTPRVNISLGPSRSFYFRVNGLPVFGKGANSIPNDQFESRVTPALLWDYLSSAQAAHMTMLRLWGGGLYERDEFYEYCDRLGIMVYHGEIMSAVACTRPICVDLITYPICVFLCRESRSGDCVCRCNVL